MEKLKSLIDEMIDRISDLEFSFLHLDDLNWVGPVFFVSLGTIGGRALFDAFRSANDGRDLWLR